jgi:hypothetical protein
MKCLGVICQEIYNCRSKSVCIGVTARLVTTCCLGVAAVQVVFPCAPRLLLRRCMPAASFPWLGVPIQMTCMLLYLVLTCLQCCTGAAAGAYRHGVRCRVSRRDAQQMSAEYLLSSHRHVIVTHCTAQGNACLTEVQVIRMESYNLSGMHNSGCFLLSSTTLHGACYALKWLLSAKQHIVCMGCTGCAIMHRSGCFLPTTHAAWHTLPIPATRQRRKAACASPEVVGAALLWDHALVG